jgi:hypothetical protein
MRLTACFLPCLALAACGQADNSTKETEPSIQPVAKEAVTPAAGSGGRASRFTQLGDQACGPEKIVEETGDWDRRCEGVDPYDLEWGSGDLREDLTVIEGGTHTNLRIPTLVAGGAFAALGKTVEWRGQNEQAPDVMVVRVHVADAEGKNDSGRLAVARLGKTPCIVAIVPPGAGQSDRARAVADGKLPGCLSAD